MTHDSDRAYEAVRDSLRELAGADRSLEAPAHIERLVMQAWDSEHRPRAPGRPFVRTAMTAAAAAVVVVAAWMWVASRALQPASDDHPGQVSIAADETRSPSLSVHQGDSPHEPVTPPVGLHTAPRATAIVSAARGARAARETGTTGPRFTPVTFVMVGAPMTPGEQVRVVRMRIGRDTLMAMGLRAIDADGTDAVDVEVLVGEDGVARGLRAGM